MLLIFLTQTGRSSTGKKAPPNMKLRLVMSQLTGSPFFRTTMNATEMNPKLMKINVDREKIIKIERKFAEERENEKKRSPAMKITHS